MRPGLGNPNFLSPAAIAADPKIQPSPISTLVYYLKTFVHRFKRELRNILDIKFWLVGRKR